MVEQPPVVDIQSPVHATPTSDATPEAIIMIRLIRRRDITMITRQLATLLHAGMPLVPSLHALHEQLHEESGRHKHLAQMIGHIRDRVTGGAALSEALDKK